MTEDTTFFTIEMSDSIITKLESLAKKRDLTFKEAVQEAFANEIFFSKALLEGSQVLLKRPNGVIERVVFSQA